MKILVNEMPQEPKDCLFSEYELRGEFYVCKLRQYIPEADRTGSGYKPRCICNCSNCENLEVLE